MGFAIEFRTKNGLEQVVLKEQSTGTEAVILPRYGALLHAFSVRSAGVLMNVIDHYENETELGEALALSFKSAKLSPFPCRISKAKYRFNNKDLEFQTRFPDGSAIHGLLYNKPFVNSGAFSDEGRAVVKLHYDYNEDDSGFPFKYRCIVEYSLLPKNTLRIKTTIDNSGNTVMPIADGWHPYFAMGEKTDGLQLQFHAQAGIELNDELVPTGRLLPDATFNEMRQIGDMQFDNCYLLEKHHSGPACTLHSPKTGITLSLFPDAAYPYLQIFTPSHRNSIAIENLSAAPNCFNNGMGLLLLEVGHSQSFTVEYRLSTR